ncbi:MAG: hypothetical protein JXP34_10470 [Planctomycetes bacterium]|nr:hypothetical protein [Planctomycetota bacterium]
MRRGRVLGPFLLYAAFGVVSLRGVLAKPGFLLNGDWIPYWRPEIARTFSFQWLEKWSDIMGVLGGPFVHQNEWPYRLITSLAGFLGIPGEIFQRIIILSLFGLTGASVHAFLRRRGCGAWASFAGGFFAVANPVFFDYIAMGWIYVILAMALLPFALDLYVRSVRERDMALAVWVGVLWAVAFCQSQTLVWYPLAFLLATPAAAERVRDLPRIAGTFLVAGLVFTALHAFWAVPLLFFPESLVVRPTSVYDAVRFGVRITEGNLIRLWGSLFNYQFEASSARIAPWLTFAPAGLAFGALFLRRRARWVAGFALIAVLPYVFWAFRVDLLRVPFSTIIRDVGRFLSLAAIAYAVLIGFTIEALLRGGRAERPSARRVAGFCALLILAVHASPLWKGGLYRAGRHGGGGALYGFDWRLRPFSFPPSYEDLERELAGDAAVRKGLWLPTGGGLSTTRDPRFQEPYAELQDIVAGYSRAGCQIFLSDKCVGPERAFQEALVHAAVGEGDLPLAPLARWAGIGHLIVRRGFASYGGVSGEEICRRLEEEPGIERVEDAGDYELFRVTGAPERVWASRPLFTFSEPFDVHLADLLPFIDAGRSAVFVAEQAATTEGPRGAARLEIDGVRARFGALGDTIVVPADPEAFLLALARPYLEIRRTPSDRAEFDVDEPGEYEIWLPPDFAASGSIGRLLGPAGGRPGPAVARLFAPAAAATEPPAWGLLHRGRLEAGRHAIAFEREGVLAVVAMPVALREELTRGLASKRVGILGAFAAGHADFASFRDGPFTPNLYARVKRTPDEVTIPLLDALRDALAGPSPYPLAPSAAGEVVFRAAPADRSDSVEPLERAPGDVIVLRPDPPSEIDPSDRLRLEWTDQGPEELHLLSVIDLDGDGVADLLACSEEDEARILKDTFLLRRTFSSFEAFRWERRSKNVSEEVAQRGETAVFTFPSRGARDGKEEVSLRLEISYELADYPYVILSSALDDPDRQGIFFEIELDADRNGRAERRIRAPMQPGEPGSPRATRIDFLKVLREEDPSFAGGQVLAVRVILERPADPSGAHTDARRFELAEIGIVRKDSILPVDRALSLGRVIIADIADIADAAEPASEEPSVRDIPIGEIARAESPDPPRMRPRLLAVIVVPDATDAPARFRIRALDILRTGTDLIDIAAWPTRLRIGEDARAPDRLTVAAGGLAFLDRFALAPAAAQAAAGPLPPLPLLAGPREDGEDPARWQIEGSPAVLVNAWEDGIAIASRQVGARPGSALIRLPVAADLRAFPRLEGMFRYVRRGGPPVRLTLRISLDPDPLARPSTWIAEETGLDAFVAEASDAPLRRLEIPLLARVQARYPFAPAYRLREVAFHAPEGDYDLLISELALRGGAPGAGDAPPESRHALADWTAHVQSGRLLFAGGDRTSLSWLPAAEAPEPVRGASLFSLARTFDPIEVSAGSSMLYLDVALPPSAPVALSARLRGSRGRDGAPLQKVLRDPAGRWIDLRGVLGDDARLSGIDLEFEWAGLPPLGVLPEVSLGGLTIARAGSVPLPEFLEQAWDLEPACAWDARFLDEHILTSWQWTATGGSAWHRVEGGELRIGSRFDESVSGEPFVRIRTKTPRIDLRRFPFLRLEGTVDDPRARSVDLELYIDGGAGRSGRSVRVPLPPGLPVLDLGPIVASIFPDAGAGEVPALAGIAVYLTAAREGRGGVERGGTRELRLRRIAVFGRERSRRSLWESLADEPLFRIDRRVLRPSDFPGLLDAMCAPEGRSASGPAISLEAGTHRFEAYAHPLVAARSLLLLPEGASPPLPEIAWRRVNATRYVASVRAQAPFLLVLNELFHPGWRAYIRGEERRGGESRSAILSHLRDAGGADPIPDADHWIANGYANGFFIRRTGASEVVVEFFPQRYLEAGLLATAAAIAGIAALALVRGWRRRRGGRTIDARIRAGSAPHPAEVEEAVEGKVRDLEETR